MYDFNIPGFMPQRPRREVEYVHGVDSAMRYQLAPGDSVVLMDCDSDRFYFLRADSVGTVKARTFRFEEERQEPAQVEHPDYVRRDEIASMVREELERWSSDEQHS